MNNSEKIDWALEEYNHGIRETKTQLIIFTSK